MPYLRSVRLSSGSYSTSARAIPCRSAPDQAQTVVFALHEGTKVRIERREQDWLLIRLANGLGGWLPAAAVTEI